MNTAQTPASVGLDWLTTPLTPDELEWKIQSVSKSSDRPKTLVVPYIDNRAVMQRLDKAFGIGGWQSHFQEITGGFLCSITAVIDGTPVIKTDGANRTDIEPVKGGISDAMKRCAVQFGLGRDLYRYPKVYLDGELKFIPGWGVILLDRLVGAFNGGRLDRAVYILKEADANRPSQQPS